jgi:hypoxanthine phosphoribosyltransferase
MAASVSAEQLTFGTIDPETGKLHLSWEDAYGISYDLGQRVIDHCVKTGEAFDKLLTVPRGGLFPTNVVSREINCSGVNILQASLGSYEDGSTERNTGFEYGQMPREEDVADKDILIVEEVCDTGHTLVELHRILGEMGAKSLRSAVLHYKPGQTETGFVPDLAVNTTDRWIVYPWEENELNGKNSGVSVMRKQLLVPNQAIHIERAHAA